MHSILAAPSNLAPRGVTNTPSTGATTANCVVTYPRCRLNDILLSVGVVTSNDTIATPTGWSLIGGSPITSTNSGNKVRTYLWSKTVDAAFLDAGSTVTFVKTGTVATWSVQAISVSGSSGIDAGSIVAGFSTVVGDALIPAITPSVPHCLIIAIATNRALGTNVMTVSGGYIEWADKVRVDFAHQILPSGTLGSATFICSSGTIAWVTFAVAFKP